MYKLMDINTFLNDKYLLSLIYGNNQALRGK